MDRVLKLSRLQKHSLQFAITNYYCLGLQFKNLNLKIHKFNL